MTVERRQSTPGRVAIRPQALSQLVTAIVADAARVPVSRATAVLQDRRGALAVRTTVPALLEEEATLVDCAERIRDHVVWGLAQLADRTVAAVDVRFTGVFRPEPRRVR